MSTTNIIQQLQNTLSKKYDLDIDVREKNELEEMFGPTFASQYNQSSDVDVSNSAAADSPYTTNVAIPPAKSDSGGKRRKPRKLLVDEAKKKNSDDEDDISADDEAAMAAQAGEEEIEDATG